MKSNAQLLKGIWLKAGLTPTIIVFGLLLLSLLWSTLLVKLRTERETDISNATKAAANLARAFEEHTVRTLREADQVLTLMKYRYAAQGRKIDLSRLSVEGPMEGGIYTYLSIIDERGNLVAGSRPFSPMNLADREHYRAHVERDTGRLFISKPLVGRASGKTSVQLTRRINRADGSFGGVAVVSVDPDYFSRIYGELDLGKRGLVALIGRDDGIIRARRSGDDTAVGQDASKAPLFAQFSSSRQGSYVSPSVIDGVSRVLSYRGLADYPLVVVVGVATGEALAAFDLRARNYYEAALLASLLIAGFTAVLLLLVSRQKKTESRLRRNAEIAQLLESLSRAAGEAATPEAALQVCLTRLFDFGGWTLARIGTYRSGSDFRFPDRSVWHAADPARFEDFIRASDSFDHFAPDGQFLSVVLRHKKSVWAEDLSIAPRYGRLKVALASGLRSGFAFPVVVHGEVVAFLEFYADGTRSPDPLMIAATEAISAQLARLIERSRAADANARLAAIVENSNDAIIGRTLEGIATSWNAGAERMFGYAASEVIGKSTAPLILPPDMRGRVDQNIEKVRRGEIVPPYETVRMGKGGRLIEVQSSVSPIRDERGEVTGASVIFRDISALKQAESAARESERRLSTLMDNLPGMAYRCRNDARWTAEILSKGFEELTGYATTHFIAGRLAYVDLIEPEDRQRCWDATQRAIDARTHFTVEYRIRAADGAVKWVWEHGCGVYDETGALLALEGIVIDISERKRAERELLGRTALTELLESLARAVNEAVTPEAAMRACLTRICEHGGWTLGRVAMFAPGKTECAPTMTLWHGAGEERYAEFVRSSECKEHDTTSGHFVGKALRERKPVWIRDISQDPGLGRLEVARKAGLRAAFVFPVVAQDETAAFLEFFTEEIREPNTLLLEAASTVAAQLARVIERGRALADLRQSEHQIRLMTDNVPAMIAYFDADLRCQFANRSYCEFRGIDPGRVVGMTRAEIIGDGAGGPDLAPLRAGMPVTDRQLHRGRTGDLRHIEFRRVPDLSSDGAFRGYYAMLLDVTEQVRAQTAIQTSEARLRAILDNEPECVKVIRTDGTLLEMNRAGLTMLDAESMGEVCEHGLMNFVRPEYRNRFQEFVLSAAKGEASKFEFEVEGLKGTRRWMQSYAAPLTLPENGHDTLVVVTRDVTERRQAEDRADYLSRYDALTGLPNRGLFRDRLESAFAHARRRNEALGVMVANLDRFKEVNESLGNEGGDELLRAVALRLGAELREVDTIARLGGNDYAFLVEGVTAVEQVSAVAEKLLGALAEPFDVRGREVFVSASIGVAVYPHDSGDAQALVENAEIAMARVKQEGGGHFRIFEPQSVALRGKRLDFEFKLRRALENGELAAHYQPKVSLRTGAVTGAEALLRWNNPELGQVSPAQFIPIAEDTGLIVPIGAWVLETACAQAVRWLSEGHDINIAVNLSPRQFRQKDLAKTVAEILARTGLAAQRLELEITEGTAMSNAEQTVTVLGDLHRLGVQLAVDDFGTGYSSLSYLRRFPLHCLKIDRSFVRDVASDPHSQAIVRATVALAHSLKLNVVAEGIETDAQRDLLAVAGCDEYQGFRFSRPLPASEFGALLSDRRPQIARIASRR